jgi:hypothetical protein
MVQVCSADENYRRKLFEKIRNARTKEEAQELALKMWHDMNATQEGFICRGCANCEFADEQISGPRPSSSSPGH